MISLRFRLNMVLSVSVVVLALVQWYAVYYTINHLMEEFVIDNLDKDAEGLLADYVRHSNIGMDPAHLDTATHYNHPYSGHYFTLISSHETHRSRSQWDFAINAGSVQVGEVHWSQQPGPLQQQLTVRHAAYKVGEETVEILVALDVADFQEDSNILLLFYSLFTLLAIVVLILAQNRVVGGSLKPLDRIYRQIDAMQRGEVTYLQGDVPPELEPLVSQVNQLLSTLQQRLKRSRNAMGNLSHSLKHPLAMLHQHLSALQAQAPSADIAELRAELGRIENLMNRELKRARLAGAGNLTDRFDCEKDSKGLLNTLKAIYRDKDIHWIEEISRNTSCQFDREDVLEVMGNLLDNACKWAKSQVKLYVDCDDGLNIVVEDDGPGINAGLRQQIMQRGKRIDESVAGHGLGLSIVLDVLEAYGGTIALESSKLGGLQVRVSLPNGPVLVGKQSI